MTRKKIFTSLLSVLLSIPITMFAMNVVENNGTINTTPQTIYSNPSVNTNQPSVLSGGNVSGGGNVGAGTNIGGYVQNGNNFNTSGAGVSGTFHVPGIAVGVGGSYLIENNNVIGVQNPIDTNVVSGEQNSSARVEALEKKNINSKIIDGALIIDGQGNPDGLTTQDMKDIFRPEGIDTLGELKIWAEDYVGNDLRIKRLYYKDSTLDITYTLNSKLFGFINKKYDLQIHCDTLAHTYNLRKPRWVILSKNDLNSLGLSFSQVVPAAFSAEILAKMEKNSTYDNVAFMIEVLNHTMFITVSIGNSIN